MNHNRVRITKPPAPILPSVQSSPAPQPPAEFRVGQHEELLERVQNGFKETLRVLDEIAKQHQDVHVVVQLDTSVQNEILEVVKEIRENLKPSGITQAEEDALAQQLNDSASPLEAAVEANQPKSSTARKKKKK